MVVAVPDRIPPLPPPRLGKITVKVVRVFTVWFDAGPRSLQPPDPALFVNEWGGHEPL